MMEEREVIPQASLDGDLELPKDGRIRKLPNNGNGRPPGTPNKLTADVKAMIIGALNAGGGQAYLERQMEENPKAFMALLGRVVPLAVTDGDGGPLALGSRIEVVFVSGQKAIAGSAEAER